MRPLIVLLALALVAACSKAAGTATPPAAAPASAAPATTPPSTGPAALAALQYAAALKARLPRIRKLINITENNDPNNLLGRPNGYTSAAVLIDPNGASCQGANFGVNCGATIEVWPSVQDVAARVERIQGILKSAGSFLGSEYDYPAGPALLRVYGTIKPSTAKEYEAAWRKIAH